MLDPTVSAHYVGDCRKLLKQLPAGCVQTCVTSPPYWGLRDYDKDGQIGLERTPKAYVDVLVKVFTQVHRVLRDDGTLWLNLGDCYAGSGRGGYAGGKTGLEGSVEGQDQSRAARCRQGGMHNGAIVEGAIGRRWVPPPRGLKNKDLVGIPWMVAFALRDAGWYLRMDNIWSKPNPMPESVTDRPTKSHEYLFLLSKSASYYYDDKAIAEPVAWDGQHRNLIEPYPTAVPGAPTHNGLRSYRSGNKERKDRADHGGARARSTNQKFGVPWDAADHETRNKRSVWEVPASVDLAFAREQAQAWARLVADLEAPPPRPSVWTVTPVPYRGAHFATFPPDLIEPCILAGSRPGDLVLDPFFGSGTTGEVAEKHERLWIGFDIQPKYADLARERTAQRSLPLSRSSR